MMASQTTIYPIDFIATVISSVLPGATMSFAPAQII